MLGYLFLVAFCLSVTNAAPPNMIRYAYIWVGGFKDGGDHVAVVDVQPGSPTFSQIYHREYIPASPTRILVNSEAHHIFLNYDKTVMMATLVGAGSKDDIYLFDMDPETHFPHFRKSMTVGNNHCSDTFTPYDQAAGTYMLSQRCNTTGGGAGSYSAISLFNPVTEVSSKWDQLTTASPEYAGFHPHIGFRCQSNVVWANYYKTPQSVLYQFNVDGSFKQAIALPGQSADPLEVQWVPGVAGNANCSAGVAITGNRENLLVLWKPDVPAAVTLVNFTAMFGQTVFSTTSSFFTTNKDKSQLRLVATVQQRYVVLVDVNPLTSTANVIFTFDFCNPPSDWGVPYQACSLSDLATLPASHLTKFDATLNRFFVNNYFTAAQPGTRTSHLFQFSEDSDSFSYVADYHPDLAGGSPHGLVYAEFKAPKVVAPPIPEEEDEGGRMMVVGWAMSLAVVVVSLLL